MSKNAYWYNWDNRPEYIDNALNTTWDVRTYNKYPTKCERGPYLAVYRNLTLLDSTPVHIAPVTRIYE